MSGITDLDELLRELNPVLREGEFVFATSSKAIDAEARIVEAGGPTLVLRRAVAEWEDLPFEGTYAWITLTVNSSLEAVGLTAAVAGRLARAGIACNMLAGLHHDHLLVPSDRADEAVRLLVGLSEA